MQKLFDKDESAPDAQTLEDYKKENNIEASDRIHGYLRITYLDYSLFFYCSTESVFYSERLYCGVFEELYRYNNFNEWADSIQAELNLAGMLQIHV